MPPPSSWKTPNVLPSASSRYVLASSRGIHGGQADAPVLADVLDGLVDDTQVPQPEKVHLDQAHGFAGRVVEAGDLHAVRGAHVQRDAVGELRLGQDHRGGVHAGAAGEALHPAGCVDDPLHVLFVVVHLPDLGGLAVPLVGGVEDGSQRGGFAVLVRWERLGDPLAVGVGVAEDA
jgi:hypothetical protein